MDVTGDSDNRGLFGVTAAGAEIRDLLLDGSVEGASNVAGLIGYAANTKVENCGVNVTVTATGTNGGGIIGRGDEKCAIKNCYSMGALSEGCAAIAGQGKITNCYYLTGAASEGGDAVEKDALREGGSGNPLRRGGKRRIPAEKSDGNL